MMKWIITLDTHPMQSWQIFRMRKQLLPDITALIVIMKTSSENGAGKNCTISAHDVFLNKSDEETSPAPVCVRPPQITADLIQI